MTDRDAALIHAIAFAPTRCRAYFRVLAKTHHADEARRTVAAIIADQIERLNLEVRQKPPSRGHSTP